MKIEVTAADIHKADKQVYLYHGLRRLCCPVVIAVGRYFPEYTVEVNINLWPEGQVGAEPAPARSFLLTPEVRSFIRAYDREEMPDPFSFELPD